LFQLRWLFRNMGKRYRVGFFVAMSFSLITGIILLINPFLTSKLIDEVIIGQNTQPLAGLLIAMFAVHLIRIALRFAMIMLLERASQNMLSNMRHHLFGVLQYQESGFFDTHRTGDLMTRFSGDLDMCRHGMAAICYQTLDCIVMFTSATIFLFVIDWRLTLALVAVTPMLMLVTWLYSKKVRPLFIDMRERMSRLNTVTQENIAGNRVVRAFAREDYENDKFAECNTAFRDANLAINKRWLTFFPIIESLANAMTVITIFLGGFLIIKDMLSPGDLAIFTSLTWALAAPMRSLGSLLNDIQRFFTSSNKVIEIYYSRPLVTDRLDALARTEHPRGHVKFDNVSFTYSRNKTEAMVLNDVSFEILPGQTLAILGSTGSGKTSIISLLARLYDVTSGEVSIDGCDVRMWKLQELRRAIGVATQEVFLFSDTVEGNIAFGDGELSVDDVKDFAHRAAAANFVEKMPEGYDTIIGERGVGLSGGQRQRIALARAMAMRPSILVLDDTTSAVDLETEMYLQKQFRELPFQCTKIIIAQRISSVCDADCILVLNDGRITERGTHEELLKNRGYYWETYALQNDIPVEGGVTA